MSWKCRTCEFLNVDELGEYDSRRDTHRHYYCTNFPRKRREIKFSIYRKDNDPKWCPKEKNEREKS